MNTKSENVYAQPHCGLGFQMQRTDGSVASRSGRNTRASAACDAVKPEAMMAKSEGRYESGLQ